MGGKSYYCDYCRCYMKNDKNVRKIHTDGMQHKIIKATIMRKYEDPRKIYEEEINKISCFRYFKGYCKFDSLCQFSHFNETQLKQLQKIVHRLSSNSRETAKYNLQAKSIELINLPWRNSLSKKVFKSLPSKLPPSLRPLNLKKLSKLDSKINKWGSE